MNTEPDEWIYRRALFGDREALGQLADRYYPSLLAFAVRVTGQAQLAEDLVQETFVRLLKYRGDAPATFRPWLFRIAHNLICDHFRSASERREMLFDFDEKRHKGFGVDEDGIESISDHDERKAKAIFLLRNLPLPQREVIILRFYHNLSLEEIAQVTEAPLGTIKSRLYRGLQIARQILEREEVKPDEKE